MGKENTVLCPPPVGWYLFYPSHIRLAGPNPAGGKGPEPVEPFWVQAVGGKSEVLAANLLGHLRLKTGVSAIPGH